MGARERLGLAVQAGRIAGYRLTESVSARRPPRPGEVPVRTDDLTTEWLSAALCSGTPGASVDSFTLGDTTSGTSARRSLTVTYNDIGTAAGLPEQLFTKTTPDLVTRLFTGLTNLFVGEANFYNVLRRQLEIESLIGYFAAFDTRSCRSIIIMEDVARTQGAVFGSPQTLHIDHTRAVDMVEVMATYHAEFWDSPMLDDLTWLRSSEDWQRHLDAMINTEAMVRRGLVRAESVLPESVSRRQADIWPAFAASLERKSRRPVTLLHHDVHSKNWYLTDDGRMGLYDWQTVVKGTWAIDFAYAVNCGLQVEDRRTWLPELLDRYRCALAEAGVDAPSATEARQLYREQSIHGLIFWLATIGAGRLQPDLHDEKDCLLNIERLAHAVADADTLDALI
ncbi:phosphotransferase [Gordonia sp. NPDC003376]